MSDLEIAIGVMGSASALYGFVIVYHMFARSSQVQERDRFDRTLPEEEKPRMMWLLWWRGLWLDRFLILATLLFLLSAGTTGLHLLGNSLASVGADFVGLSVVFRWPGFVLIGLFLFLVLVIGVGAWFFALSREHVIHVWKEIGGLEGEPQKGRLRRGDFEKHVPNGKDARPRGRA